MRGKTLIGAERERGAALVEFALILPLFMTLVLGMFTGGLAYNQKLTMTAAARETSRYGATLPVSPSCGAVSGSTNLDKWLYCVIDVAVQTSTGELAVNTAGRSICVAYVKPAALGAGVTNDQTRRLTYGLTNTGSPQGGACPGAPAVTGNQRQVQVVLQRDSEIQLLFFKIPITLEGASVTRFER